MPILNKLAHYFFPQHSNNYKAKFLHSQLLLFISGVFAFYQLFIVSHPVIRSSVLGYASRINQLEIIQTTNQKRVEQGRSVLREDSSLEAAAKAKAEDMFAKDYWAHVSPDGTEPWYFVTSAGYNYLIAGENLARDFDDSSSVVEAWMNSPSHRENLLNSKFQDIGVAAINGNLGGIETTLVVQMFGTKISSVPPKTTRNSKKSPKILADLTTPSEINRAGTDLSPGEKNNNTRDRYGKVNPFLLTKGLASFILIFLVSLFLIDLIYINSKNIVRLSSNSAAHVAFLISIAVVVWIIKAGVIL